MQKKQGRLVWLTPLLLALPTAAALACAALAYGGTIQKLIRVAVKLAVIK